MSNTEAIYLKFIMAAIHEQKMADIDENQIDLNALILLSKKHKNPAIVYAGMQYYDICDSIKKTFLKGFHVSVLAYSKMISVMNEIGTLFCENKIPHIIIKGSTVAKYYPSPELRVMNDVDLVLHYDDKQKAEDILLKNGAVFLPEESDIYNTACKFQNKNIELHYNIAYHINLPNDFDYEKYFKRLWDNIELIEGSTYQLNFAYNFIYDIFHTARHFYKNGCGVRMLSDVALMIKNSDNNVDWNFIMNELELIGLKDFTVKLLWLCRKWFQISLPDVDIDFENVSCPVDVEQYILNAGVFGFSNVSEDIGSIRMASDNGYMRGILNWAFPSYRHMKTYSPWFQNKPAFLLPIAYVERLFRNAKERGGLFRWLRAIKKGRKTNDYHKYILRVMELEKDE